MASHTTRSTPRDRGDVLAGWLLKLTLAGALVALVAFDGLAVVSARFSAQDHGVAAARAASETWQRTRSVDAALASATSDALAHDAGNRLPADRFRVAADGTVHLTISRAASTLLAHRLPPLRRWCTVSVQASGRNVSA